MERQLVEGILAAIFVSGALSFGALLFVSAPYGKQFRQGWGPALPPRLAWMIMEQPAFWLPLLFFLLGGHGPGPVRPVFLLLWELHYAQRTFLYPLLLPARGKPFPVLLVALGFLFNALNGYAMGYALFGSGASYAPAWLLSGRFLAGTALFLLGFAANLHADATLRRLKARGGGAYGIPRGGLFRFVSCPNYLGEIVEWCGFAVLTWSAPGLAFAFFTFCNLAPRALASHRWYRGHFPDYPPSRKAFLPFVW